MPNALSIRGFLAYHLRKVQAWIFWLHSTLTFQTYSRGRVVFLLFFSARTIVVWLRVARPSIHANNQQSPAVSQTVRGHTIMQRRSPPFSFLTPPSFNTHSTRQSTSSKSHHASSYRHHGMPRYCCRPLQRPRLRSVDRARNTRTGTAIHLCVQGGRRRWRKWENGTANAAIW